jgi:hypothetical protein
MSLLQENYQATPRDRGEGGGGHDDNDDDVDDDGNVKYAGESLGEIKELLI